MRTDAAGAFLLRRVADGEPLLTVRTAGYAAFRQRLDARAAARPVEVELQRGSRLELSLDPLLGEGPAAAGEELAHVHLFPRAGGPRSAGGTQSAFPWHLLGPLRLAPGGTLVVDDLPPCLVDVRVLHARGSGAKSAVGLEPGRTTLVEAHLVAASVITGRVLHDARPVAGVEVTLHAADAAAVTAALLGERQMLARMMAPPPAALQTACSGIDGGFTFGVPPGDTALYLTLTRDGHAVHVRLPRSCRCLDVDLASLGRGGTLER